MAEAAVQWFVIVVQPKKLDLASQILEDIGCEVFAPLQKIWRHYPASRVRPAYSRASLIPIFGSYAFVGDTKDIGPARINGCRGIRKMVMTADGEPGIVPANEIKTLMRAHRKAVYARKREECSLTPGTKVRLISGPLCGFEGMFQNFGKVRNMAQVIIAGMGRGVPVDVYLDDIAEVD